MWFEKLTGFKEESPENVRAKLKIEGQSFISEVNKKRFTFGELEIVTLEKLRENQPTLKEHKTKIKLREVISDVQELHRMPENKNALFQAASQFNLLEMVGPEITPEKGIDRYERDYTQGPACAIACGAGTIYRNYFVHVNGRIGQTFDNQIDCLDLIGDELKNKELHLWSMNNGYAIIHEKGLLAINKKLGTLKEDEREDLKGKLKVGIQWDTEVTLSQNQQKVTQVYCSALPVTYCSPDPIYWEYFARLILEATYEATLYAALINMKKTNCNLVFLTLVGGGSFGNQEYWIIESLQKALLKFKNTPLDIRMVSYGRSNQNIQELIHEIKQTEN